MKPANTPTPIRLLVVDDHQLFREAIVSCLVKEENIGIVGEVDNGVDTLLLIRQTQPDIVLMDISLTGMNGLETTRLISAAGLKTKVLVLSMHSSQRYVKLALSLGVWGYVRKQEAFEDLIKAITQVAQGKRYYSPSLNVDPNVLQVKSAGATQKTTHKPHLTKRETEIVTLVAKGLSNHEIAEMSFLSIKTVETHRSNINRKLQTHNSADITRYAIRHGLITP
jgi:DNA-binding NarL/FixJ family response regulator